MTCDCTTRCFGVRALSNGCQNLPAASVMDVYKRPLTPRMRKMADETDAKLRRATANVVWFGQ